MSTTSRRILLSSVSSDAHTWNLAYLQLLLGEHGNRVDNLGACVPDDLFVSHAARTGPDLIVLSTVNGHGFSDGLRLIRKVREVDSLRGIPAVIGGKLGIAGELSIEEEQQLRDAGFNEVFSRNANIRDFLGLVESIAVMEVAAEHPV